MPERRPATPLHPEANQEIEAPGQEIPQELTSALDLGGSDSEGPDDPRLHVEGIQDEEDDDEDELEQNDEPMASADEIEQDSLLEKGDGNIELGPSCTYFDPDTIQRQTPLNPFGGNDGMSSSNPIRIVRRKSNAGERSAVDSTGGAPAAPRRLSMNQQSRLINYIDDQLLAIQRRFIKHLSSREDPDDMGQTAPFELKDLLSELDHVVTIIWYSIFNVKQVPFVYHTNVLTEGERRSLVGADGKSEIELEDITPDFLFGQTNYLIKIMGDLGDYLERYEFETFTDVHQTLMLFAKLDNIVSILIDEYEGYDENAIDDDDGDEATETTAKTGGTPFISNTEKVRIESIISGTKMLVIHMFDRFKENGASRKRTSDGELDGDINRSELLIGEIYEGILDRTSI